MPDKPLIWLGSSRRDLRAFPALARRLAGFQLRRVQQGLDPDDWKPIQTVGPGVRSTFFTHLRRRRRRRAPTIYGSGGTGFGQWGSWGSSMAKRSAVRVTPSTGNIFRDLGFSKEESEHLLVRADLLIQVQKAIMSRGLKQAECAKVLRVTQPRVSDLLRGRIDLFSTDALIDMLARLGLGVRLVVKPTRTRKVA